MRRAAKEIGVETYPETFLDQETNTLMESYGDEEALKAAIAAPPTGQRTAIEHFLRSAFNGLETISDAQGRVLARANVMQPA